MGKKSVKKEYQDRELARLLRNLSRNVTNARKVADLSQLSLASQASLGISTISEIETGKRIQDVRLSTITAMARVLKIKDPLQLLK